MPNTRCANNPSGTFQNATVKGRLLVPGQGNITTADICHLNVLEDARIQCLAVADKEINAVIGPVGTVLLQEGQVLFQTLQEAVDDAQQWDLGVVSLNLILPTGVVRQNFTEDLSVGNVSSNSVLVVNGPSGDQFGLGHVQGHPQSAVNAPAALGGGGNATLATGVNTITVTYPAGTNPAYNTLATPVLNGDQLLAYSSVSGVVSALTITSVSGNVINLLGVPPNLSGPGSAIVFSPRITTNRISVAAALQRVVLNYLEFDYSSAVSSAIELESAAGFSGTHVVVRQLIPATANNVGIRGNSTWDSVAVLSSQGHSNRQSVSSLINSLIIVLPGGPAASYGVQSSATGEVRILNSYVGGGPPIQGVLEQPDRYSSIVAALVLASEKGSIVLDIVDLLLDGQADARAAAVASAAGSNVWGTQVTQTSAVPAGTYIGPLAHSWQNSALTYVDAVSTLAGPPAGIGAIHYQTSFGSRLSISGGASDTQNGDIGIRVPQNSQASAQSIPLDANSGAGTPPTSAVSLGVFGATNVQAVYDLQDNANVADAFVNTSSYYRMSPSP